MVSQLTQDKRVLVALSGRMDSAVTAALLKTEGYQVIGLHFRMSLPESLKTQFASRCLLNDGEDSARKIASKLGVPLHVVEVGEDLIANVVDTAIHAGIRMQRTNPCIPCHQKIKVGTLIREADRLKCHWVSTGHFARISLEVSSRAAKTEEPPTARLRKASDSPHDQSHLLFELPQETLARFLTPLGGISRSMVRKLAQEFHLTAASEEGGGEECLQKKQGYWSFIESFSSPSLRPGGMIRSPQGELLGEHKGLYRYLLGDRIEDPKITQSRPNDHFVVGYEWHANGLIIGPEALLFQKSFSCNQAIWMKSRNSMKGISCTARIGARTQEVPCQVTLFEARMVQIDFEKPVRAVTPGEAVVFYQGDEVLGGAYIQSVVYQRPGQGVDGSEKRLR